MSFYTSGIAFPSRDALHDSGKVALVPLKAWAPAIMAMLVFG